MNYLMKFPMINYLRWFGCLIICISGISLYGEQELPPTPQKLIVDYTQKTLNAQEIEALNEKLGQFKDSTQCVLCVVIENSSNGVGAFERAKFLARGWGLGNGEQNNGILLYIAIQDHEIFMLTGNHTQDRLTEGRIGPMINDLIKPYFRENQYAEGISQAITQTKTFLGSKPGNGEKHVKSKKKRGIWGPFIVVILIFIAIIRSGRNGRGGGFGRGGFYSPPLFFFGSGFGGGNSGSDWGGSSGGGNFGGFDGGGGFNGGGAGGSW